MSVSDLSNLPYARPRPAEALPAMPSAVRAALLAAAASTGFAAAQLLGRGYGQGLGAARDALWLDLYRQSPRPGQSSNEGAFTPKAIARVFGRDHSSVLEGIQRAKARLAAVEAGW